VKWWVGNYTLEKHNLGSQQAAQHRMQVSSSVCTLLAPSGCHKDGFGLRQHGWTLLNDMWGYQASKDSESQLCTQDTSSCRCLQSSINGVSLVQRMRVGVISSHPLAAGWHCYIRHHGPHIHTVQVRVSQASTVMAILHKSGGCNDLYTPCSLACAALLQPGPEGAPEPAGVPAHLAELHKEGEDHGEWVPPRVDVLWC
jgi:hypothetical protein